MNDKNLPQTINKNIFIKLKMWFFSFFKKNKTNANENTEILDNNKGKEQTSNFKTDIQLESFNKIFTLQKKLKDNQIKISDLTNNELDEMIKLYRNQISEKKIKLRQYRKNLHQTDNIA